MAGREGKKIRAGRVQPAPAGGAADPLAPQGASAGPGTASRQVPKDSVLQRRASGKKKSGQNRVSQMNRLQSSVTECKNVNYGMGVVTIGPGDGLV